MSSLSISLTEWVAQAGDKANLVVKSIIIDLTRRIDEKSPVGKKELWAANVERASRGLAALPAGYIGGRFRGNWQLGVDAPVSGTLDTVDSDGSSTLSAAMSAIPAETIGHTFYYTNNLPYALRLENGHSRQAPIGIVGLSILEWQGIVRRNARGGARS